MLSMRDAPPLAPIAAPTAAQRCGHVAPVAALVLLALGVHFARLPALPLRGEETRRAQIAIEMIDSGDWVVPRQQGQPFLSRPPLQNWAIAAMGLARGQFDVWTIRLPSALAVLATALVVYCYGLTFLSRVGAFAAGAAFLTFGQVLELGNLGETESLFTLLVSSSLLVWHGLRQRGLAAPPRLSVSFSDPKTEAPSPKSKVCSPWFYWPAAYALVGLGLLTKGPQAPLYFAASVGVYLLVTRRWREAVVLPHAAGIGVLLLIWGTWQAAFCRTLGLDAMRGIYGGDVAMRFEDTSLTTFVGHLVAFPAEILLACLIPWSVLLVAYCNRHFRAAIGPARDQVLFLAVCIAVTFPTCWLPPGARGRYYMPLYPCFALLIGLVVERCRHAATRESYRPLWRHFLAVAAIGMAATGAAVALVSKSAGKLGELWTAPLPFFVVMGLLAAATLWARAGRSAVRYAAGAACVAAFAGLIWNGPVINAKLAISEQATAAAVNELKRQLPPDARLVSIGPTDHLFAFYFGEPIPQRAWPREANAEIDYFCYSTLFSECPPPDELPFPFEKLAVISCERQKLDQPQRVVIVGRRLDAQTCRRDDRTQR